MAVKIRPELSYSKDSVMKLDKVNDLEQKTVTKSFSKKLVEVHFEGF